MGHATIYADQERVLDFVDGRLQAGDGDQDILAAGRSVEAIIQLGHVITAEDLVQAVRYLHRVLDEDGPDPLDAQACIACIRDVLVQPAV